jgi:hypothetical protein
MESVFLSILSKVGLNAAAQQGLRFEQDINGGAIRQWGSESLFGVRDRIDVVFDALLHQELIDEAFVLCERCVPRSAAATPKLQVFALLVDAYKRRPSEDRLMRLIRALQHYDGKEDAYRGHVYCAEAILSLGQGLPGVLVDSFRRKNIREFLLRSYIKYGLFWEALCEIRLVLWDEDGLATEFLMKAARLVEVATYMAREQAREGEGEEVEDLKARLEDVEQRIRSLLPEFVSVSVDSRVMDGDNETEAMAY